VVLSFIDQKELFVRLWSHSYWWRAWKSLWVAKQKKSHEISGSFKVFQLGEFFFKIKISPIYSQQKDHLWGSKIPAKANTSDLAVSVQEYWIFFIDSWKVSLILIISVSCNTNTSFSLTKIWPPDWFLLTNMILKIYYKKMMLLP